MASKYLNRSPFNIQQTLKSLNLLSSPGLAPENEGVNVEFIRRVEQEILMALSFKIGQSLFLNDLNQVTLLKLNLKSVLQQEDEQWLYSLTNYFSFLLALCGDCQADAEQFEASASSVYMGLKYLEKKSFYLNG